jgi:hypothetical protein
MLMWYRNVQAPTPLASACNGVQVYVGGMYKHTSHVSHIISPNINAYNIYNIITWIKVKGSKTQQNQNKMTWKETGNRGVFSRPVGENETFIKLTGDAGLPLNREHWAINSSAAIVPRGSHACSILTQHFRKAWAHLRFQHPSLAAEVALDDESSFTYTVPADAAALDTWVSSTFSVDEEAASSAEVIRKFSPTPYAKLVWIPASGELLGHTAHWRTDGIGVLLLLDAFLAIASQPSPLADPADLAWGTETERLAPSVEDAAAMPLLHESTVELKARGAALVATFAHTIGATGIPSLGNASTLPAGTRQASFVFNPATTDEIVTACKDKGVSVTTAVHASVAGANYELADTDAKTKHYTSTIRYGLRPYLPKPFSSPAYASGLYTTGWMKRVESDRSWADRLWEYHEEYRKGISKDFLESHREYAAQLSDLARCLPPPGDGAQPSDVDISSIGVAEKLIKQSYGSSDAGFDVMAINVGVEILTRQGVTFVWTFRNQLNLSVVFNESFHSTNQMDLFVRTIKKQLLHGLGLQGILNVQHVQE